MSKTHEPSKRSIVFLKDWRTADGKPRAMIHESTTNRSFLLIARALKLLGIKNNVFFLSLYDPALKDIDPHSLNDDTDPTGTLRQRVFRECKLNFWYFLREVVRVPAPGTNGVPFKLNRGALAMAWCYLNSVNYTATQPRQTGKTTTAIILCMWLMLIAGQNSTIAMLCHNDQLRTANVGRFKEYRDLLPTWMFQRHKGNINNSEMMSYEPLRNQYRTSVAQKERARADQVLRGLSLVLMHIDEVGYNANIDLTYPSLKASSSAAAEAAEKAGLSNGFILTTTAVDPTTVPGRFAYNLVSGAMSFTEKLYDLPNKQELKEFVRRNSKNDYVNGTFSHLQLGRDNKWLEEKIRDSNDASPDVIQREWLNRWVTMAGNPILDKELVKAMTDHRRDRGDYTEIMQGYVLTWYIPEAEALTYKNKPFIAGLDCAEFSGRDFTTLVAIDPNSRKTLFTFRCNDSNTTSFSMMMVDLMMSYRKMLLVPERKNIAIGIIDDIANSLLQRGVSPFTRIYNKVVQEKQTSQFKEIDIFDPQTFFNSAMRKQLGFMTTGKSRDILYRLILNKAAKLSYDRIYDRHLIEELASLEYKNGRIDHGADKHDDMVISWLLANFVLFEGKNLMNYGLSVDEMELPEEDGYTKEEKKRQEKLREEYKVLKKKYDDADEYWKNIYRIELNKIYEQIDKKLVNMAMIDRDKNQTVIEKVEQERKPDLFEQESEKYQMSNMFNKFFT